MLSTQNEREEKIPYLFNLLIHSFICSSHWMENSKQKPFLNYTQSTKKRTSCHWYRAVNLEHKCSVCSVQDREAKHRQS